MLHTSLLLNGPRNLAVTAVIVPMDSFGLRHLMQEHLEREAAADCQPAWQLPQQLPLPHYSCALVLLHVQKLIFSVVPVIHVVQWLHSQFHDICSRLSCQLAGDLAESNQGQRQKARRRVEQMTSSKENAPVKMALAVLATK